MTGGNDDGGRRDLRNPYVGPRAFRRGEALYGRDRESQDLTNLLIAERIVLLHAPSGAGKTSLIQASVVPMLEREGLTVTPQLRVNVEPPAEGVSNPYIYSVAVNLIGDAVDSWPDLASLSLCSVLDRIDSAQGTVSERVLFFDQFEEILTQDPADWEGHRQFFGQLGKALANTNRWALFSMREDYMGGLDRYRLDIPTQLCATYRLDFLQRDAAKQAIQLPAKERDVTFTDGAADLLFTYLAGVQVQRLGRIEEVIGPYVEPVQLQVVCHRLWRSLKRSTKKSMSVINAEDVRANTNVELVLAGFYSDAVDDVVSETKVDERVLRDWFDRQLITVDDWRKQTRTGPADGKTDTAEVLRSLENHYLIRSDVRGGTKWYELTHDRLVRPVKANNKEWRRSQLPFVQYAADRWQRSGKHDSYLLVGQPLTSARLWLRAHAEEATEADREFVQRSRDHRADASWRARVSVVVLALCLVVLVEFLYILYLVKL